MLGMQKRLSRWKVYTVLVYKALSHTTLLYTSLQAKSCKLGKNHFGLNLKKYSLLWTIQFLLGLLFQWCYFFVYTNLHGTKSFFFFQIFLYYYLLSTSLILKTFRITKLILPHPTHPKFLIKSSSSKDTLSSLLCIKLYEIKAKNCVHLAVNAAHGCGARVHPRLPLLSRS